MLKQVDRSLRKKILDLIREILDPIAIPVRYSSIHEKAICTHNVDFQGKRILWFALSLGCVRREIFRRLFDEDTDYGQDIEFYGEDKGLVQPNRDEDDDDDDDDNGRTLMYDDRSRMYWIFGVVQKN